MARLHLFHTNDFHGRLTDTGAERLRVEIARRAAGEPWLLLDAGDAIQAGNLTFNPRGEAILERMSTLGYTAMTLGNRETHPSLGVVRTKLNRATFPVLCANAQPKSPGAVAPFVPSLLKEIGGVRVALFGLTVPMITAKRTDQLFWDHLFESPLEVARQQVAALRPQADLLIALTHLGIGQDRKLAAALPELDLIIGGHTHVLLDELERVDGVAIAQAGCYGHYFGHIVWDDGTLTGEVAVLQEALS